MNDLTPIARTLSADGASRPDETAVAATAPWPASRLSTASDELPSASNEKAADKWHQPNEAVVVGETAVCAWCGGEFVPLRSWARYCHPYCRHAYYRRRREEQAWLDLSVAAVAELIDGS